MNRKVIPSAAFVRTAKRWLKKHPEDAESFRRTLELLVEDAYHPYLKTHKLKGALAGSWSCSIGHDLRLVFEFVTLEGHEAIILQSIGSHDEVY